MQKQKVFLGASLLLIVGCGGGSGGGSNGSSANSPHVLISWPVRTKAINAPSSALSCKFQLQASAASTMYSIQGNRPSGLGATVVTYTGSGTAPVGTYQLTGTFYAEPGESGPIVGTVSTSVSVQSDGTLLDTAGQTLDLTFTGTVKSVSVNPNQSVAIGKSIVVTATAYDSTGNPIVVTAGSFSYALSGSGANLQISSNGNAQGIAAGSALVTASIDGLTSTPELVLVGPSSPSYDAYAINANDIAYDSTRNVIYSGCTAQSPTYAGLVSVIDLGSNQFGPTLPTTNNPAHLAVSNDDLYLYVAGYDGTIQRFNLSTNLLDTTISLPKGTLPNQILAIPGTTESFAISVSASDGQTDEGTYILDGTTFRENVAKIGLSITTNDTGSKIYGFQVYKSSGALYSSADINPFGIGNVKSEVTVIQGSGNRIHWNQNKIISDSGAVVNPDTGATIGQFPVPAGSTLAIPVPGTDVVYFLSGNPYVVGRYSLSTLSMNYSVAVSGPSGYPNRAISLGGNRIGFHTTFGSPSAVYSVVGLP